MLISVIPSASNISVPTFAAHSSESAGSSGSPAQRQCRSEERSASSGAPYLRSWR